MTFWLLDEGPFGVLAQVVTARPDWPPSTLHVVEEVATRASRDKSGRRQAWLSACGEGGACVEVHAVPADSEAGKYMFDYLRPNEASADKDIGEHASIAFCAVRHNEAVFVTQDKGAAYLALAELGRGRVSTPFDLWAELRDAALIDRAAFDRLCAATCRGDAGLPGVPPRLRTPAG